METKSQEGSSIVPGRVGERVDGNKNLTFSEQDIFYAKQWCSRKSSEADDQIPTDTLHSFDLYVIAKTRRFRGNPSFQDRIASLRSQ
jgi:hypothetical protein